MHVTTMLTFFQRVKGRRDRIPPLSNILTDVDSESADTESRHVTESQPAAANRAAPPSLTPIQIHARPRVSSQTIHASPFHSLMPSRSHRRCDIAASSTTPRSADGKFLPNVDGYLQNLRQQGVDPFSQQGHTHLLVLLLTEVSKLRQEVCDLRSGNCGVSASVTQSFSQLRSNLGLPLSNRRAYDNFKSECEQRPAFRADVVSG